MTHDELAGLVNRDEGDEIVAAVFIRRHPERFVATVRSLLEDCKLRVWTGSPQSVVLAPLDGFQLPSLEAPSPTALVNEVWRATRAHILAITDVVLPPSGFLDVAFEYLSADLRVATVSFLSNNAGFLSFPRDRPTEQPLEGEDELSITRNLRSKTPLEGPVPIPSAVGAAVVVSSVALGTVGLLEEPASQMFSAAIADFSFRCRQRGFVDLLDHSTFYARPSDLSVELPEMFTAGLTVEDGEWLDDRHPMASAFIEDECLRRDSAIAMTLTTARAKVMGLRILVDGTCLGPFEMGTQVTTVALIQALAARDDVREVCVALSGSTPAYAISALSGSKVRAEHMHGGRLHDTERFDIFHRPFQPRQDFDPQIWREYADRVVVTVHDLISFHIGTYSGEVGVWLSYRDSMRRSLHHVDGVVVVSDDVRQQIELHRLPVNEDRIFVIANGTEHLTGEEEARLPKELFVRGYAAGQFALCLGTNYTHKNRDLAIRTFVELRRRGHDLALVLAGAGVPWGSSRLLEAEESCDVDVFVLPGVASEERNWLLRHAAVVLYPTSAEGFGLVPYEAARFGTPTVYVGFGPLAEVGGSQPVSAGSWAPELLADSAEALLTDPELARQQVLTSLSAGSGFTWARAAEGLAEMYRELLARPAAQI